MWWPNSNAKVSRITSRVFKGKKNKTAAESRLQCLSVKLGSWDYFAFISSLFQVAYN